MKKFLLIVATFVFLVTGSYTFAGPLDTGITLVPPAGTAVNPNTSINTIIQNAIKIVFVVATVLVLAMLIYGAIQWILSGGDKEAVGKARGRIIAALVGLAILALSFLILSVVGQLLGINILGGQIPTLIPK